MSREAKAMKTALDATYGALNYNSLKDLFDDDGLSGPVRDAAALVLGWLERRMEEIGHDIKIAQMQECYGEVRLDRQSLRAHEDLHKNLLLALRRKL
jgi:hypothetical protein